MAAAEAQIWPGSRVTAGTRTGVQFALFAGQRAQSRIADGACAAKTCAAHADAHGTWTQVNDRLTIEKDDIIFTAKTANYWNQYLTELRGIVTQEGSATAHPMLIGRERHLPVICGVPGRKPGWRSAIGHTHRAQGQLLALVLWCPPPPPPLSQGRKQNVCCAVYVNRKRVGVESAHVSLQPQLPPPSQSDCDCGCCAETESRLRSQ